MFLVKIAAKRRIFLGLLSPRSGEIFLGVFFPTHFKKLKKNWSLSILVSGFCVDNPPDNGPWRRTPDTLNATHWPRSLKGTLRSGKSLLYEIEFRWVLYLCADQLTPQLRPLCPTPVLSPPILCFPSFLSLRSLALPPGRARRERVSLLALPY